MTLALGVQSGGATMSALKAKFAHWWSMDGASGANESDLVGAITMQNNGTMGSTTGVVSTGTSRNGGSPTNYFEASALPSLDSSGAFLIHCNPNAGNRAILTLHDSADGNRFFYLEFRAGSNYIRIFERDGIGDSYNVVRFNATFTAGTDYQVIVQSTGSAYEVYVNNAAATYSSGTNSGDWLGDFSGLDTFRIGHDSAASTSFSGAIDEVGYAPGTTFDATERTTLYNSGNFVTYDDL